MPRTVVGTIYIYIFNLCRVVVYAIKLLGSRCSPLTFSLPGRWGLGKGMGPVTTSRPTGRNFLFLPWNLLVAGTVNEEHPPDVICHGGDNRGAHHEPVKTQTMGWRKPCCNTSCRLLMKCRSWCHAVYNIINKHVNICQLSKNRLLAGKPSTRVRFKVWTCLGSVTWCPCRGWCRWGWRDNNVSRQHCRNYLLSFEIAKPSFRRMRSLARASDGWFLAGPEPGRGADRPVQHLLRKLERSPYFWESSWLSVKRVVLYEPRAIITTTTTTPAAPTPPSHHFPRRLFILRTAHAPCP